MKIKNGKSSHLGIYISSNPLEMLQRVSGYYRRAYEGLFLEILKLGYTPTIVYNQENYYSGDGVFRKYWCVGENGDALHYSPFIEDIQLSLVFDKSRLNATDMNVVNPEIIQRICSNKYESYLFAPEWHPKTVLINNIKQLEKYTKAKQDEVIVLKELDGKGGKEVFIGKIHEFNHQLAYPIIAQDFIDSSIGVEGVCDGPHDLRVSLYNGKIISYMLRQPQTGKYVSNLSFGGNHRELDVRLVPPEIKEMAQVIDARFGTAANRFYSIDLANSPDGWKIIELNCWPGLGYDSLNEKKFTRRLARCLVDSLAEQNAII